MVIGKIDIESILPISEYKGKPVMVDGWLRSKTDPEANITDHFKVKEHQCRCGRCEYQRCDERLYPALESIRQSIGPMRINSGFRCSGHNRDIRGSKGSQHLFGLAVDIAIDSVAKAKEMVTLAVPLGFVGFGIYRNFVHLDLRDRPEIAVWGSALTDKFRRALTAEWWSHHQGEKS